MSDAITTAVAPILVGCGILHREVECLIKKNNWALDVDFISAALHNHPDRLYRELDVALGKNVQNGRRCLVFYGCCHPGMGELLQRHHSLRTAGQNCIAMLLGHECFMAWLQQGAYFLLEEWADNFANTVISSFGNKPAVIREIFHDSHRFVLALRTPCSADYQLAAQAAADFVDLPLQWLDVDLLNLQEVLRQAMQNRELQP